MVKHTLQQMLQDFWSAFGHFGTLWIKELIYKKNKVKKYYISMLKKNMIFDNFVIKDYDSFKNYVT